MLFSSTFFWRWTLEDDHWKMITSRWHSNHQQQRWHDILQQQQQQQPQLLPLPWLCQRVFSSLLDSIPNWIIACRPSRTSLSSILATSCLPPSPSSWKSKQSTVDNAPRPSDDLMYKQVDICSLLIKTPTLLSDRNKSISTIFTGIWWAIAVFQVYLITESSWGSPKRRIFEVLRISWLNFTVYSFILYILHHILPCISPSSSSTVFLEHTFSTAFSTVFFYYITRVFQTLETAILYRYSTWNFLPKYLIYYLINSKYLALKF